MHVIDLSTINSASVISSFRTESLKAEVGSLDDFYSGWSWISEHIGISKADSFSKFGLLEQINTTGDRSDYLCIDLDTSTQAVLHIESLGHALRAFINGKLAVAGKNTIDLLSLTVGLQGPNGRGTERYEREPDGRADGRGWKLGYRTGSFLVTFPTRIRKNWSDLPDRKEEQTASGY
ncbi:hypothetical protein V8G54_010056 [Vigna mungo]|uniref:Uncharacterized protein n=1 Tax=Vigna mungo TaxID=3915 RepID=A0AAQ3S643_VIGMU